MWFGSDLQKFVECFLCSPDSLKSIWIQSGYAKNGFVRISLNIAFQSFVQ